MPQKDTSKFDEASGVIIAREAYRSEAGYGGWYSAQDVRDAARGRWEDVLARFGVRVELLNRRHGPCPGCGGNDRFRFDDKNGEGTFICSQGGGGNLAGDGIALLVHVLQCEWKEAVQKIGEVLLPPDRKHRGQRVVMETGVARAPEREKAPKRPPFDLTKLRDYTRSTPPITREWLKGRSPLPVDRLSLVDVFEALYRTGECVLVFQNEYSQGDFLYQVGRGSFRLAKERNVKAVRSELPTTGRFGVWFLTNPVEGTWKAGDVKPVYEERDGVRVKVGEEEHWTRRSWPNVTDWRYMVLESDDAPEELWLRALVQLALPIAAIYSSGGRSVHALVKVDADSKPQWDAIRDQIIAPLLCPIGADGGALSAVRLSRAPQCFREGKKNKDTGRYEAFSSPQKQELIYLNPRPLLKPLLTVRR